MLGQDVGSMFAFDKSVRNEQQTRRYSILATDTGWEVREERDSEVVRQVHYQDWHRVERARRSIAIELDQLERSGWSEIKTTN